MTGYELCGRDPRSGVFFFYKQKTAYELRISDWSSGVCSSDLVECIDPDPDYPEDRESLLAKLHRLQQAEGRPPADAQATPAAAADAQPRTAWHDGPEPA